jgi:hypothetical protein
MSRRDASQAGNPSTICVIARTRYNRASESVRLSNDRAHPADEIGACRFRQASLLFGGAASRSSLVSADTRGGP